jgi:hypothetical protein
MAHKKRCVTCRKMHAVVNLVFVGGCHRTGIVTICPGCMDKPNKRYGIKGK